ncbi:MAG TPA: ABC transporter ATP-binding protein [Pyrinomonadaceae bacterium]|nr:ABC transporter ATP-binding protein [Pyrinomonadaceae bacterium]
MLEVTDITKRFDGVVALNHFSLTLKRTAITSLIGPNGSGKTTLFNIIMGLVQPEGGRVLFNSRELTGRPTHKIAGLGISRTFQDLRLFQKLTVMDNLLLASREQQGENFLYALSLFSSRSQARRLLLEKSLAMLEQFGLADKRDALVESLSYGQQKLLSLACCIAADAELLLLDEPAAGVSFTLIERMATLLDDFVRRQGRTVLLIEHNLGFVVSVSDTIVVMDEGRKIAEGSASVVQSNEEVLRTYLG